jgi:NADH-quinone oxidoreductase subunit G
VADVTLSIDGLPVTVPAGTLIVEAAKTIRTDVPVYCYHPKLGPAGLCRICLVEVEKTPKLQIACNTTVAEGMVVRTYGEKVEEGRRAVLEFLLLNHPLDCPICDKGGECDLQDFSMAYGQSASRLADPKGAKPKAVDLGPTIVLDDERCIVCQRCSRFDEIITLERSLVVMDRGQRDVIATASGEPYRSDFSGNVTELCPVGALTSKTYRFKSRPWDLERTATTCTQCSVGCALNVDVRHGEILRTMSVPDDAVSDGWLCDRGRYNVGFVSDERRLTQPLLRDGDGWTQLAWDDAIALWAAKLAAARHLDPGSIAMLGGGRLTNEEILLLGDLANALGTNHVDWRSGRQRQASPGPLGGTYADLDAAQAIVVVGRPPAQTAPVLDLRLRKAVAQSGARLILAGDQPYASPAPHERVAGADALAALTFDGVERIAFVWDGMDAIEGARAEIAMQSLLASGKRVSAFVCGEQGNARGAEGFGLLPRRGGLDTAGMLAAAREGKLAVLSIFGANPVVRTPGGPEAAHAPSGPEAVRAALGNVPFVVVSELFMTETAAAASLVLPARASFEKSGHTLDLTGALHALAPALDGPPGPLADGEMLIALCDALGVELPAPRTLRARAVAPPPVAAVAFGDAALCGPQAPLHEAAPEAPLRKAGAETTSLEPPLREAADSALRLAIAADSFAGAGTLAHDARLHELWMRPSLTLNAKTAAAAGVRAGDVVELRAGARSLAGLSVRVLDGCADGVVSVIDGLADAPASVFVGGETVTLTVSEAAALTLGEAATLTVGDTATVAANEAVTPAAQAGASGG